MSSTQSDRQLVVQCDGPECDTHGNHWNFQHQRGGVFCSDTCETRAVGRQYIGEFLRDHTICGTCFHDLKEIEKPKPDREFAIAIDYGFGVDEEGNQYRVFYGQEESRRSAVGFQHRTSHAEIGEKQHGDRVVTGTTCAECSTSDHRHHVPYLADAEGLERLLERFDERDLPESFDPETLHREWIITQDLDYAMGQAVMHRTRHCVECNAPDATWDDDAPATAEHSIGDVNLSRRQAGLPPICSPDCMDVRNDEHQRVLGRIFIPDGDE